MRLRASKAPDDATFDLTPMIDVVLLLIIFFMLSSQFSHVNLTPVELPREAGGAPTSTPKPLVIDVDRDGRVSVEGVPTSLDELTALVKAQGAETEKSPIVRVHRECESRHLNLLSEAMARGGALSWRLATNPTRTGS